MTKLVRIENADLSTYKVAVEIWQKGYPEGTPDSLIETIILGSPCQMTGSNVYLTYDRYFVVKELPADYKP